VYGVGTRSGILAWQHSRKLPETGFIGADDSAALGSQAPNSAQAPIAGAGGGKISTAADRVAADKRTRVLAFDAENGDVSALDLLHVGAARGDPSAMYGLSVFLGLEASRKHPGDGFLFTFLIDNHNGELA
jgi:peptidoglycan hydrolase-like protein with peptidoglycan-binding domain